MADGTAAATANGWFDPVLKRATGRMVAITSYLGAVGELIAGYFAIREEWFPELGHEWVIAICMVPLAVVLLTDFLPAWLQRRRDRRLVWEAQRAEGAAQAGFFRVQPYEEADAGIFQRADGAHERVLQWLQAAEPAVLYLTGDSGTGKSSLDELQKPGRVWDDPPEDLPDEPLALLQRAADELGEARLLIVFDQFEEFLILHEETQRKDVGAFLRGAGEAGFANVRALLVLREEYKGVVEDFDLPPLRQNVNWRFISAFTYAAARDLLARSGRTPRPELVERILAEASRLEGTEGLVRPITLNMVGMILERFPERLSRSFEAGRLIEGYLKEALNDPKIREHAFAVVGAMVTAEGTKRPISEGALAEATRLERSLVRGCLLTLTTDGLVRLIDEAGRVWEVSHDFLARELGRITGRHRPSLLRTLRPWLTPAALLFCGALIPGLAAYEAHRAESAFRALREIGIRVTGTTPYRVTLAETLHSSEEAIDEALTAAAPHLAEIGPFELILRDAPVSDLGPLSGLTALQTLDLKDNPVSDLGPLSGLTALQTLDLSSTLVSDLGPLAGLTSLQTLNLWNTQVSDLGLLQGLPELQTLSLQGTPVRDLGPLAGLTALQTLDLLGTPVSDLGPLAGLTALQQLSLLNTPVSDLGPLAGLTALQALDLGSTLVSDLAPLQDLAQLQRLDLGDTQVSDLGPLAGLTQLQSLGLGDTQVSDLGPLAGLPELQTLDLEDTPVSDLGPLSGLTALQTLNLKGTPMSDLGPLQDLAQLEALVIWQTEVDRLGPIQNLKLKRLDLDSTNVVDLGPLQGMKTLELLDARNTTVNDLAPLDHLDALQELYINNTPVNDLTSLHGLTQLRTLGLVGTQVDEKEVAALRATFEARGQQVAIER